MLFVSLAVISLFIAISAIAVFYITEYCKDSDYDKDSVCNLCEKESCEGCEMLKKR